MNIIIGADLVPTKSNCRYFEAGDVDKLIGKDLQGKLRTADFTIFNLEVPLTDTASPIEKCGPNLIAPTASVAGLQAINPYFFTLANNHIMDQGAQGLAETLQVLEQAGIRVGIYCCAEYEFSIAEENLPGANPFDPLESPDQVSRLKESCDYLIVLYHGGKEHYRYPSPYLQKVCRKLISKGADLVVCQHSHCIGAREQWKEGTIVYGQGNFLFDRSESEYWQTGLLIDLTLSRRLSGMKQPTDDTTNARDQAPDSASNMALDMASDKASDPAGDLEARISYIPLRKSAETVRLAEQEDAAAILTAFDRRSEEVKDPALMEKKYRQFADSMLEGYLSAFSGKKSLLYRLCNKLTGYRLSKWTLKRRYGKTERIAIRNYVECEAHRELALRGLRV